MSNLPISLYAITSNMLALLDCEAATPEEIEGVFGELVAKDNRIAHFRADLKGEIAKFKAEEQRLSARRKAIENLVDRLEGYIKESMDRLDIEVIEAGTFKISLQNSPPSLVIDDIDKIPSQYMTVIPQTYKVQTDIIKAEIKAGTEVPGAHVEQGKHIRIR